MGVDSGLPDFRGNQGFWKAYPPFRGRSYSEIASPQLMEQDPVQAWGFYGHCLGLYRATIPHEGFSILKNWTEKIIPDYFVFTSNIDGHFSRSGFNPENILEIHGSIHFMQCSRGLKCSTKIWSAKDFSITVDEATIRAVSELPSCPDCQSIARPNILMFGDRAWNPLRTAAQENNFEQWITNQKNKNIVALEFGAGTAVPTVRYECRKRSTTLIRVNPRDYQAPEDAISIPLNALDTIKLIDKALNI